MEPIPIYIAEENRLVTRNHQIKEIFISQINKVEYIDTTLISEYNDNIEKIIELRKEGSKKPYDE